MARDAPIRPRTIAGGHGPARARGVPTATAVSVGERWWEWVTERRLACGPAPTGHHIPVTFRIADAGFILCQHWIGLERRECGLWVFALAIRGSGVIVAGVTLDEVDVMKELETPTAMLSYLDIWPTRTVAAHRKSV